MTAANFKALKRLRWIAENKIDFGEHFAMDSWFRHEGDHPIRCRAGVPIPTDCGTSACLLGWGLTDKRFRDAAKMRLVRDVAGFDVAYLKPSGDFRQEALGRKLKIDSECVDFLFFNDIDVQEDRPSRRKKRVLARIDAVLGAGGVYSEIPNPDAL